MACQDCHNSCLSCDGNTDQNCTACQSDKVIISGKCTPCDYQCLTCTLNSSNCNSCQENRTLQKGGICMCNDGYFEDISNQKCSKCDQSCLTCSDSTNSGCKTCQNDRILNLGSGSCICKPGSYENPSLKICVQCHYSCKTCSGPNANNCIQCQENRTFNNSSCACNEGFYDDSGQKSCISCHYSCLSCKNGLTSGCNICQQNRQFDINGACKCNNGFYDDSNALKCLPCDYSCYTCSAGSKSSCNSCQINRTISNGVCNCNQGFFEDTFNNQCSPCHYSCLTCNDKTQSGCLLCQSNRQNQGGVCICNDGYFEDINNQKCSKCDQSCLTCFDSTNTGCKTCQNDRILNSGSGSGSCICKPGSYENPSLKICVQCHYSCRTCSGPNANNCILCQDYRTLNMNSCLCNQGFYDDSDQKSCVPCHYSCLSCKNSLTSGCNNCQKNRQFDINGLCKCNNGFYDDSSALKCLPCDYSCNTCSAGSKSSCNSCQINRTISNGVCNCNQGFFEDTLNNQCSPCHYSCLTCNDKTQSGCLLCQSNRQNQGGVCICNDGYFEDINNQKCSKCNQLCLTCFDSTNTGCKTCQNDRILNPGLCSCICKPGSYEDPSLKICVQCHYSCKTCSGPNANNCIQCQENRTFNNSSCACNQGFYDDSGQKSCISCHYSCLSCKNGLTSGCNICQQNRQFDINGVCKCNNGFYDDSNALKCLPCDYSCNTCTAGIKSACISCQVNRFFQNGACICNDGYFEDLSKKQCSPCNYTCQKCNNQSSCIACNETRYFSTNNQGQCLCLQGYFDNGKSSMCIPCHQTCFNCIGSSQNMCTQCNQSKNFIPSDPYSISFSCVCVSNSFYSDSLNTCILCDKRCASCNGALQDQCLTCSPSLNRILLGSSCVCIQNYFENSQGLCQPCHSSCQNCIGSTKFQCTSCDSTQNRFYNNKYSVCDCIPGYYDILLPFQYGKPTQQTCLQCDSLCKECNSNKSCLSCINNLTVQPNYQCSCQQGYYLDQNRKFCQKCFYTCSDCIGPEQTDCLVCKQNMISEPSYVQTNFPYNQLYKCSCQQNDLIQNCIKCHYSCKAFQCNINYPNICLDCPQNRKMLNLIINSQNNTLCICDDGYYEDKLTLQCMKCNNKCLTCNGPLELDCLSCNQNRQFINQVFQINGQCQCPQGYLDNETTFQCIQCSNTCLKCSGNKNYCTACKLNAFLNSLGVCTCKQNYYQTLDGSCQKCHNSCSNCIGETQFDCIYCSSYTRSLKIINSQLLSGSCLCNEGYFEIGESNCQQCSYTCKTCIKAADYCLSCVPLEVSNRLLINNKCVCRTAFQENLNGICTKCPYDCLTCDSRGGCIQCINRQRKLNIKTKRCDCCDGYYESKDRQCLKCNYRCKNCFQSPDICTQCDDNQYLNNEFVCKCSDGFYEVTPTQSQIDSAPEVKFQMCAKCHYSCNTCNNSSTCQTCLLSQSNVFFNQQTKLCECYFGSQMKVDYEANSFTCIQQANFNIESIFCRNIQDKLKQIMQILIKIFNFTTIFSLLFGQYVVSDIGQQMVFDIQIFLYYNGMKLNFLIEFLEIFDENSVFKMLNKINPFKNLNLQKTYLSVYLENYDITTSYLENGGSFLLILITLQIINFILRKTIFHNRYVELDQLYKISKGRTFLSNLYHNYIKLIFISISSCLMYYFQFNLVLSTQDNTIQHQEQQSLFQSTILSIQW
ncbi:hypothetical protein ABPG74_021760 [Tetrahymena malaccensis]